MAYDEIKPTGGTKASKPDSGGANIRSVPVLAIVKDNIDPTRAGRLRVYIADFGSANDNSSTSWITVSYMSPFYGLTQATGPSDKDSFGTYLQNPSSYGMWNSPPDIGTTVVCIFINGDTNYGFYIGCVPQPEALYMVPAIGASDNVVTNDSEAKSYGGATRLPVVNINTNNKSISDSVGFLDKAKPVHSYVAGILNQQGLLRDPIRGTIGSSAQRESPSRVGHGVSTPGRPIYEGGFDDQTIVDNLSSKSPEKLKVISRRAGHTFVMDDGDIIGRDQLIRLRTSMGHQILMSDDGQCLHIIHSNGQSWIELGKEGTIDMYATNSVNIRTQGDLNLHADNNININAAKAFNVAAESIHLSSEKESTHKVGTDYNLYAAAKYTIKVGAGMSMASGGEASYSSSSLTYINGSKVNLNTGSASLVPAEVKPTPIVAHTDTLYDSTVGFAAAPGKLMSIVSRAPAHAPWASAGQGVDVKVTLNASAALPAAPAPAVAATNGAAASTPNPVKASVAATVPPVAAVSSALDKNVTAAITAAVSTNAATGLGAAAVSLGAGIVQTTAGAVASVGTLALSPAQLCSAGILKPGASTLIDSLAQSGKSINQILTPNLFTGAPGAENLAALVKNPTSQAAALVTNLQQSQAALTTAGVMTGKESGNQVAGIVMAGATVGVPATVDFIQNSRKGQ